MSEKKKWEGYSVESLYNGIRSCEVNIRTFEDAIKKERATMVEYRWMISKIEEKRETARKAEAAQDFVNKDIQRQNAEHVARFPNLKSIQIRGEGKWR